MKKPFLIPLFATSMLMGCQDADTQTSIKQPLSEQDSKIVKKVSAQWVGNYQGTTPCMGCISRCDECPGMAVDLELKDDMTYVLQRESLSQHGDIERVEGKLIFKDAQQTQLELLNVKTRNQLFWDLENQRLEIHQDQTAQAFVAQDDFILDKAEDKV